MDNTQDNTPDETADANTHNTLNSTYTPKQRLERIEKQFRPRRTPLKAITVQEKKERLLKIQKCIDLGMSIEQMTQFLPTWGIPASRTRVYEYLSDLKLSKRYKEHQQTDSKQSHHDYFTFYSFIPIARGFAKIGEMASRLSKGAAVWEGFRFRHDFRFNIAKYLYYMEIQLSDLSHTRWRQKLREYVKLYEIIKRPFRVLVVLDQHGNMSSVRRQARSVLQAHPHLNLGLQQIKNDHLPS